LPVRQLADYGSFRLIIFYFFGQMERPINISVCQKFTRAFHAIFLNNYKLCHSKYLALPRREKGKT
jgi:hypothetical protein